MSRVLIRHALLIVTLCLHSMGWALPQGTGFTYQGELVVSGVPADGEYDFSFRLYKQASDGLPIGLTPMVIPDLQVNAGLFTVELDFGSVFRGEQLWLQIEVRDGASTGAYTTLVPRQKLTAVPYSLHAKMVSTNTITSAEIADNTITAADIAANAITSAEIADNTITSDEIADNSITSDEIADNTITAADVASNAIGSDEIISGQVQLRVGGTCEAGTYLTGINQDGSVQCAVLPVGVVRTLIRAETGVTGPGSNSIAIRNNGLPIISFVELNGQDALHIFDCANEACSSGTIHVLDTDGNVGDESSIAIRDNGLPIISYHDNGNGSLKVFSCADTACSSGTARTLDNSSADVGRWTSLAIRDNGLPFISYRDETNQDLKAYDCADISCSSGVARLLDGGFAADVGWYTSLAIRDDGRPIISYHDVTNGSLKAYDCANTICSAGFSRTLTTGGKGLWSSIAIRHDGLPVISHIRWPDAELYAYHCSDTLCSSGFDFQLDYVSKGAQWSGIAIRDNGLPIIAYKDFTNHALKVYLCHNFSCTKGVARTLFSAEFIIPDLIEIGIRTNGLPIISFRESSNGDLMIYSCGDPNCEN